MANRFDPFDTEIRGCFCPLCMTLASAHARHMLSALSAASDALFAALEAGTHTAQGPRGSLIKGRGYQSSGGFMASGMGLGVTPGGVTGSTYRRSSRG